MSASAPPAIVAELHRLLAHAHAPHSGVQVAAAVEGGDGVIHYGVNVENAAYPQGVCAEASAISAMVTSGGKTIRRVWVASNLPELIWPCGGCRQKIWEFAEADCEVVSVCDGQAEAHSIGELLPFGFSLAPPSDR
jgi:cytidine deaminase